GVSPLRRFGAEPRHVSLCHGEVRGSSSRIARRSLVARRSRRKRSCECRTVHEAHGPGNGGRAGRRLQRGRRRSHGRGERQRWRRGPVGVRRRFLARRSVKVDVHDRLDAVGEAAWTELHARTTLRSPFLAWIWQHQWAEVFTTGHRLEIWRVKDADQLVALLPLYEAGPGVFRILGGADISDYLDLIAVAGREEEAWAALLGASATRATVWALHAVPASPPTVTSAPTLAATVGLETKVALEERCPVLTLPPSWEAYLASLPGKHRHELSRKMRRLEREAPG